MERFHVIDDAACILRSKGHFRQVKVYRRGERVFAGWAGGYIQLGAGGGTSNPNVSWIEYEADGVTLNSVRQPVFAAISAVAA